MESTTKIEKIKSQINSEIKLNDIFYDTKVQGFVDGLKATLAIVEKVESED